MTVKELQKHKKELEKMGKFAEKLSKDKKLSDKFFFKAGICTKDGKDLTEQYK